MDDALAVYLPVDRRHALATGTPLLEHTQGAALFADISGFTPLTEALTRELGPRRGAEELPRQLNIVYDALIREVDRYGGSVIGFAGDAITCWFDGDAGLRATACGLAMQAAMQTFATVTLPSGGTASLAMKAAVAAGAVRRFLVGDPRVQLIDALAGATLSRMAAAEHMAEKGEVLLDERTVYALGAALNIQAWRTDEDGARFAVVTALHEPVTPQPWAPLAPGSLRPDELRPWLLPTVYERLQAGQGEFLTELRPAVALFLRFDSIDYDADPEAGQKLDAFIRWVQSLLLQYEGTLIQLTIGEKGNYLYAAFGAPIVHEDDARRAALTALKLRTPPEELAFISEVQIGLTRGTMRTGAYGGTTRRTYGSLGDEVNLAARLMQYARPGQIIASQRVQAATETLFTWQPLEQIRVKGKSDPIAIFSLVGARRTATIHLQEPSYTLPMVGRVPELALIEEKLHLVQQGQGQIVGITAEAGMGKSRLVAEVIRRATRAGLEGYGGECHSFGTNTPYLVWQPLWRAFFALDEAESVEEQARQLAAELARLNPALLPRLPLLGRVLGLPLPDNDFTRPFTAEQRKGSREALLVDVLKARAATTPLLLVLEDAHWLDALSQELLDSIARAIWTLPVLIVLAYRPLEALARPVPQALSLPTFSEVLLTALTPAEATQLIDAKLTERRATHYEPLQRVVVEQLMARTEGNPFYIEELLNYLHEQELDVYDPAVLTRLDLPTSLHALILSRIDQLAEPQKITMKVASVIGRLFRFAWLYGYYPALGDPTEVKQELEVLRRLDLTPLEQPEPELTYLFKHIVTQEVAYESLAFATRAILHAQLGGFIESLPGETPDAHLDLLAYHYERSENQAKACEYLHRAGDAAAAAYAHSAAQGYYERLLARLARTDAARVAVLCALGEVLGRQGILEAATACYQEALNGAGAAHEQATAWQGLGNVYVKQGVYQEAIHALEQARAGFAAIGDGVRASQVQAALGEVYRIRGEYSQARSLLTAAREGARAVGAQNVEALTLILLGTLTWYQADFTTALMLGKESLAISRALGDRWRAAEALQLLALVTTEKCDYGEARSILEETLAEQQAVGDQVGFCRSLIAWANLSYHDGDNTTAQSLYEESLALARELGARLEIARAAYNSTLPLMLQGEWERARPFLEESLMIGRELGSRILIAYSLFTLAHVVLELGERALAQSYLTECLPLCRELGSMQPTPETLVQAAALRKDLGAARLLGAASSLIVTQGRVWEHVEQQVYDQAEARIRAALGEAPYQTAFAAGEALSLDEAIDEALASLSGLTETAPGGPPASAAGGMARPGESSVKP